MLNEINTIENNNSVSGKDDGKSVSVEEDDQTYSEYAIGSPPNQKYSKVLGVNGDSNTDKFIFDLCNIVEFANLLPPTKRSVLKIVA